MGDNEGGRWGKKVDSSWEIVQIKAFTHWVNTVLVKRERKVEDLSTDFETGVNLINFLELLSGISLKQKYIKNPRMRIQKIQNIHLALLHLDQEMGVRLVGIGAEDFCDGQLKLILGFLWTLFRKYKIAVIKEEDKSSEEGLLLWVKKQTEDYPGVEIDSFRHSFRDGNAFLALVDSYKEGLIDYPAEIENESKEEKLENAFKYAEEHLGIPRLLDPTEVKEGSVDERGMVLYVSLYFHAFNALSEREKLERSKREMTERFQEKEDELKRQQEEREALEREREELRKKQEELNDMLSSKAANYDELSSQNEALRSALSELNAAFEEQRSEIADLRSQLKKSKQEGAELTEKGTYLDEKVTVLKELLAQETEEKEELEETSDLLAAKLKETEEAAKSAAEEYEEKLRLMKEALEKETQLKEAEIATLEKERLRGESEYNGLRLLKKQLELHVDDLQRWQKYLNMDKDAFLDFDEVARELETELDKSSFEKQVALMTEKLEGENTSIHKMLKIKQREFKEQIEKEKKKQKDAKGKESKSATTKGSSAKGKKGKK